MTHPSHITSSLREHALAHYKQPEGVKKRPTTRLYALAEAVASGTDISPKRLLRHGEVVLTRLLADLSDKQAVRSRAAYVVWWLKREK